MPLNINDADLSPQMSELPQPHVGVTEMTFVLIQNEIISAQRRLRQSSSTGAFSAITQKLSLAEKEHILKELSEHLESTYLVYCDQAGPIMTAAATLARLMVSNLSLVVYGLVGGNASNSIDLLPQPVKDRLFSTCIGSIEQTRSLSIDSNTKKFAWIFKAEVQWYAMAYILREVGLREPSELVEKGWKVVDSVFAGWGDEGPPQKSNATLWRPMRKLMMNARRKREAARLTSLQEAESSSPRAPTFSVDQPSTSDGLMFVTRNESFVGQHHNTTGPSSLPTVADNWRGTAGPSIYSNNSDPSLGSGFHIPPKPENQQIYDEMMVQNQNIPWLFEDYGPLGPGVENMDIPFESWDDVVRDFNMDVDPNTNTNSGMGRIDNGSFW